jgi:hypothetical protein
MVVCLFHNHVSTDDVITVDQEAKDYGGRISGLTEDIILSLCWRVEKQPEQPSRRKYLTRPKIENTHICGNVFCIPYIEHDFEIC